jgi:hypothetical protein
LLLFEIETRFPKLLLFQQTNSLCFWIQEERLVKAGGEDGGLRSTLKLPPSFDSPFDLGPRKLKKLKEQHLTR